MAAFDKLPRQVRDALNSANFPFAPQRLRTMLRRGASVGEVVQTVRDADLRETARTPRGRARAKVVTTGAQSAKVHCAPSGA